MYFHDIGCSLIRTKFDARRALWTSRRIMGGYRREKLRIHTSIGAVIDHTLLLLHGRCRRVGTSAYVL